MTRSERRLSYFLLCFSALSFTSAYGKVDIEPHAIINYSYNSNLFEIPNVGVPLQIDSKGVSRRAERTLSYGGGVDLNGVWNAATLDIMSNIQGYRNENFRSLDLADSEFSAEFGWNIFSKLSGEIAANYAERLVEFAQFAIIDPNQPGAADANSYKQTDRRISNSIELLLTKKWRLGDVFTYFRNTVPYQADATTIAAAEVTQQSNEVFVDYFLTSALAFGFASISTEGQYTTVDIIPDYSIRSTLAQMKFVPSNEFQFTVSYGKSGYNQAGQDLNSNVGEVQLNHVFSPKTTYYISFRRGFEVYPATGASVLTSNAFAGFRWQALPRVRLLIDVGTLEADISANATDLTTAASSRNDKFKIGSLSVEYSILKKLRVAPYFTIRSRNSNDPLYHFESNIYGIRLTYGPQAND